ncbi:MAG: hypothetical protein SGBAC_004872 [Bacillariaceae sp.]
MSPTNSHEFRRPRSYSKGQETKPFFSGRIIFATFVLYAIFSSYTFWSSYSESLSIQLATMSSPYSAANVFCPESLAMANLTRDHERRMNAIQHTNEELLKTNEELLAKLKKQSNETKVLRFDLIQLSRRVQHELETGTPPPVVHNQSIGTLLRYLPLNVIDVNDLHLSDYMADTWMTKKENFLQLKPPPDVAGIQTATRPSMTKDWTDFSIEHLSHIWSLFNVTHSEDESMLEEVILNLYAFLRLAKRRKSLYSAYDKVHKHQGDTVMKRTIAMIAFQPMIAAVDKEAMETLSDEEARKLQERADLLTTYSLAVTIASLYQVGFGRIVVVGYRDEDELGVRGAFELIHNAFPDEAPSTNGTATILPEGPHAFQLKLNGTTEVAYSRIYDEKWVFTRHVPVSMVRGSIVGMQKALKGELNDTMTMEWLGRNHADIINYWKYVYLSEPDTILNTKPWLLPSIRQQLDQGHSFYPHRINPLPHQEDFPITSKKHPGMFLPKNVHPFSNVSTLDPLSHFGSHSAFPDACCDGGDVLPGRTKEFGTGRFPCRDGYWWFFCGFDHHEDNETSAQMDQEQLAREEHKRLLEYPMIRFRDGSGMVWASNERGRRCFPSNGQCR